MNETNTETPTENTPKPKRAYHRRVASAPKVALTPRVIERNERTKIVPRPKSARVTYIPIDPNDPPYQEFGGIRFLANTPVEVPYAKTIEQLISEKYEAESGEMRRRTREVKTPVPVALKGNPWFEIDGERTERQKPLTRLPETADGYRNYCISWIATSMSADSMDKRWIGEEGLRQRCGVSPAEISYLRPFFEARRMECAELDKTRTA